MLPPFKVAACNLPDMTIHFYIRFSSQPGENLVLRLYDKKQAEQVRLPLHYLNPEFWHLTIREDDLLTYTSLIYDCILETEGQEHRLLIPPRRFDLRKVHSAHVDIYDEPDPPGYLSNIFELPAFRLLALPKNRAAKRYADKNYTVAFNVFAPALPAGKILCITGSGKKLRQWTTTDPIPLYRKAGHWSIKLNLPADKTIQYKYVIYDTIRNTITEWESGDNREIHTPGKKNTTILFEYARIHQQSWKGAGLQIAVQSLRSVDDWGIGEITTMIPFIDWASDAGFSLIQTLPLLDTTVTHTRRDSYPYAPISAFALHPLLLNVKLMARRSGVELPEQLLLQVVSDNRSKVVNFDSIYATKWEALRMIYDKEKQSFHDDLEWFAFFDVNREWLVPYAAFCCLRDKFKTADFSQWEQYAVYDEDKVNEMAAPDSADYDAIGFYYFLQYHLHLQLNAVVEQAKKKQVILKGDLTVGVARYSVDTWMSPHYFDMDRDYGAPPDVFSPKGQNWGFPVYNVAAHHSDGYAWWRKRLEHTAKYFQAVRIDHVLGFFRMFAIPHRTGDSTEGIFIPSYALQEKDFADANLPLPEYWCRKENTGGEVVVIREENGFHLRAGITLTDWYKQQPDYIQHGINVLHQKYFYEMQNDLWKNTGTPHLKTLLYSTDLFVCAEDLGMMPSFVPELLQELQIPGLHIQRMRATPADPFPNLQQAPYLSVVTTATHDMPTLREWWETERTEAQAFFNDVLGYHELAPYFCEAPLVKQIIDMNLRSPAMLAIFLLQDILAMHEGLRRPSPAEERINAPLDPEHIWDYRLHITVEELAEQKQFQSHVADMILSAGR